VNPRAACPTWGFDVAMIPDHLHCRLRNIEVRTDQSLTRCIIENQCFDDDPCPLQTHFNARRVKRLVCAGGAAVAGSDALRDSGKHPRR